MRRPLAAPLTVLVVVLAASLALTGCAASSGAGASGGAARDVAARPLVVTGYALAGDAAPSTITRDGDLVDTVGVDGVTLGAPGRVSPVTAEMTALRDAARRAGRSPVLLLSNYSDRLGDFDEPAAWRMLSSRAHRRAAARALAVRARGYDGVQLDLESLRRRDLPGLTAFTRAVRRALPRGRTVSMALMTSDSDAGYRALGYDLPTLGRLLDVVVVMTYDQHGPWSGPGPVASLPWVRRTLDFLLTRVPRAKVDLGAAAYGYQWGGGAAELSVPDARRVAGDAARWSERDAEWHATLPGGRTLWWDDARSVEVRRRLAASERLHGLAVWQLGSSGDLRP